MLKDKKFLVLIFLIILLPLLTIVLTSILQGCQNRGSSFETYEKNMIVAAKNYFNKNKILPNEEGKIVKVNLDTLINKKYIKSSQRLLKDSSCKGYVIARKNGSSLEKNNGGFINYLAYLKCKNYETNTLNKKIMENITKTKSGLYKVDDEYIFKGDNVKNYITFYDRNYRILGITSTGLIKLLKSEYEPMSRMWDNKYNIELKQPYGKNIYSDSLILKYLNDDYFNEKKISKAAREHIVSNYACVGKRSKNDYAISRTLDCNETIENQVVSLMSVSDYALASTDPDCNSIVSRSCNNYNYLRNIASATWTTNVVKENTYEVFTLNSGVITTLNANEYNYYNIVIYVDGNEKVTSGKGTIEEPYIVK